MRQRKVLLLPVVIAAFILGLLFGLLFTVATTDPPVVYDYGNEQVWKQRAYEAMAAYHNCWLAYKETVGEEPWPEPAFDPVEVTPMDSTPNIFMPSTGGVSD